MRWLRESGVISDWWQYQGLPLHVLDDCRLLMEAEDQRSQIAQYRAAAEARRYG